MGMTPYGVLGVAKKTFYIPDELLRSTGACHDDLHVTAADRTPTSRSINESGASRSLSHSSVALLQDPVHPLTACLRCATANPSRARRLAAKPGSATCRANAVP